MAEFQFRLWPTTCGDVAVYGGESLSAEVSRPVAVFLHGALRRSEALLPWAELVRPFDAVFVDLPGHGRSSSLGSASIDGMAEAVHQALAAALPARRVLLVGESLGGTIALAVGGMQDGPVKAVFAADPPMTTGKLWNLASVLRSTLAESTGPTFLGRLARETFGIFPDRVEERIYYPLLAALQVPTVIATGDIPLLPPRRLSGVACLFDDVDRFVVQTLYPGKAQLEQIPNCGHVMLEQAEEACLKIIRSLLVTLAAEAAGFARPAC